MSRIAVLGAPPRVDAWALAGAMVVPAAGDAEVRRAWEELAPDVEVVIVTPDVAALIGDRVDDRLVVVLP